MKAKVRILSMILAAVMLFSTMVTGFAAEPEAGGEAEPITGSISLTLRVDRDQKLAELRERGVKAELFNGNGALIGEISLTEAGSRQVGQYTAAVSHRNGDGGALNGGEWPAYLDASVQGLPIGEYTLKFTGSGYVSYTHRINMIDYSKHLTLGTGDATFTLGDVNGDGEINGDDVKAVSSALGSKSSVDTAVYDLNGDGKINIIDLAYVSRAVNASGEAVLADTAFLALKVDMSQSEDDMKSFKTEIVNDAVLEDLVQDNGKEVTLASTNDNGEIILPITLSESVDIEELQVVSPEGDNAPQQGNVLVTDEDGATYSFDFDIAPPVGLHAIGKNPDNSVITISLGKRVAVKKITITVTKTAGDSGYATVESIQFLKDIVPENPVAPNSEVKNLAATAGDEKVSLKWSALPNVSGYRIEYWSQDGSEEAKQKTVEVTSADILGLSNGKTYLFTVTPIDGDWSGKPCAPAIATPESTKPPAAPDMVNIGVLDSALRVSWKASENATFYEVYYRSGDGEYAQAGGTLYGTSTTIDGLTNDVTYSIYVVAGNSVGKSGPSRIYEGTPKAVIYERPEGIPTAGILDKSLIASVALAAPSNSTVVPFDTKNIIDDNYKTAWTVKNWWSNEHVICTFTEPVDLSSVIWVPRLDGGYPTNLRAYSVRVWREGDDLNGAGTLIVPDPSKGGIDNGGTSRDVDTWPGVRNNPAATKFAVLPFEPVTDVVKISVAVEQRAYLTISLAELMFVEYDPERDLADNISALFADELYTKLKDGVSQSDIDELRARLNSDEKNYYMNLNTMADELNLAEELLAGETKGVVINGIDSRSSGVDSRKYGQGGSDLQPLGAAASANQEITVYASGIPEGQKVTLYASQYNAEASTWRAEIGKIENGRNILTVPKIGSQNTPRGGSLYLTYSGADAQNIKLHVRRGRDIPMLDLSDWYIMSESDRRAAISEYVSELTAYVQTLGNSNKTTNCMNVTEIATPVVLLSIPASSVYDNSGKTAEERANSLYNTVLAWEDIMHICKTTQGIDNTYEKNDMQSRQNIRCMQMFAGAFMYAAGNHIGIGYSSCGGMVTGRPISMLPEGAAANSLFGWGIAHEIGHNMDKLGKAEITNNIYSLMVQTYDGDKNILRSRLEGGKYSAIFTKTATGYPGASNDVFVQLGMYWQLHLAYDDGDDPMAFYNSFFKAWKAGTYTAGASSYDDRVALTAAGIAQKNLTEFFTRWGMTLSQSAKDKLAEYPNESRAIWYLNDQSRRERIAGTAAASGEIAVSAVLDAEAKNKVNITITPSVNGKIQGYEIIRGSKSVEFVAANADGSAEYTDFIGSANHRTFNYKVIAYDILGNKIGGTVSAGDIRIAYDAVIDPSEYTISRDGADVKIIFKSETAISGMKLVGEKRPAEGGYTVIVEDADGKKITAREGTFNAANQAADDKESYLTYFNKPGTESTDTRIWTYDAKSVTISGIPEDMPLADVRIISYAGDDVAFTEGGAVGRLLEDYVYGTADDEVIKAGTLVVVGTYRGDPVYNTVKIKGRFTKADAEGAETTEERYLNGYTLMFAEIPEDKQVSDISDGLFIFVPDLEAESELQGDISHCDSEGQLPAWMQAVLSRTDMPDSAESQRVTAESIWINSPSEKDLPNIALEG